MMMTPAVVAAYLVSLLVCWLMIRLGPKDAPDGGRKTQARAVPSAGGLGVLAGMAAGLLLAEIIYPAELDGPITTLAQSALAGPLILVLVSAALGFVDDKFNLPAGSKLLVLAGASLLAALYGPQIVSVWVPGLGEGGLILPYVVSVAGVALWLFVMTNAVNFMDGANGIAMGSAAVMLAGMAVIALPPAGAAPGVLVLLLLVAVAAIAGFLAWNLRGLLYAGDTGALAMGALIGGAGAAIAAISSIWVAGVIVLPVLVDVFMTLIWRARNGRPLMQAHRDHAYQLCLRSGWSHIRVAALWWALSLVCAIAGYVGARLGAAPAFGIFICLLIIGVSLWGWQRRTFGRRLLAEGR